LVVAGFKTGPGRDMQHYRRPNRERCRSMAEERAAMAGGEARLRNLSSRRGETTALLFTSSIAGTQRASNRSITTAASIHRAITHATFAPSNQFVAGGAFEQMLLEQPAAPAIQRSGALVYNRRPPVFR